MVALQSSEAVAAHFFAHVFGVHVRGNQHGGAAAGILARLGGSKPADRREVAVDGEGQEQRVYLAARRDPARELPELAQAALVRRVLQVAPVRGSFGEVPLLVEMCVRVEDPIRNKALEFALEQFPVRITQLPARNCAVASQSVSSTRAIVSRPAETEFNL